MANSNNKNKKTSVNSSKEVKKTTNKIADTKKEVKANSKKAENKKTSAAKSPAKKEGTAKTAPKKEVKKSVSEEELSKEVVEEVLKEVKKEPKKKSSFTLTSKQKDIVLVLLVGVVLIIATILSGEKKLNVDLPVKLNGEAGYTELAYNSYKEKVSNNEFFLLVIVRDGCGYCEQYEPIVKETAENLGLPIYYMNLTHMDQNDANELISKNKFFRKNQQWGTPTTIFMYGENVVDSIGGYVPKEDFEKFAKKNFVVKENDK